MPYYPTNEETFQEITTNKLKDLYKILFNIISDAVVIIVAYLIGWVIYKVALWVGESGEHDLFIKVFYYISFIGTTLYAILLLLSDIKKAIRNLWKS